MATCRHALLLLAPALCALLSGCGSLRGSSSTTVQLVERNGVDMIAAPAGHVSLAIKDATSSERICGGRMPDAIMDSSMALSLPVKGVGVGSSNTDLALGGRNPQVLIIRELLYRLCEITLNSNLPANEVVELYKDTLPMVSIALKTSMGGTAAVSVVGEGIAPPATPAPAAVQSQNPYAGGAPASSLESYSSSSDDPSSRGGVIPSGGNLQPGGVVQPGGITPSGGNAPAGAGTSAGGGVTPAAGADAAWGNDPAGGIIPGSPGTDSGPASPAASGAAGTQN